MVTRVIGHEDEIGEFGLRQIAGAPRIDVKVTVEKGGVEVTRTRDGTMIGEMSYIQGGNATATVRATRPTRCLVWPADELRHLLKRNPTMDIAMSSVFSLDLAKKLAGA